MIVLDWGQFCGKTMLNTIKKNWIFMLISSSCCILLTISKDFFPYIYILPALTFMLDSKISKDSQKPFGIAVVNFIKCFFILCDFYLPSTITKLTGNPMVEWATPGIYYFTGISLLLVPALFVYFSRKKTPRGLIRLKNRSRPQTVFLHGKKGKFDERCIMKEMKPRIPELDVGFFDMKMTSDPGVMVKVFRPFQTMGIYSVNPRYIFGVEGKKFQGNLEYYRYRKKGFGKKPDIVVRVASKEYARNLRNGAKVIEVKMPPSGNRNKILSINLGTKGKLFLKYG